MRLGLLPQRARQWHASQPVKPALSVGLEAVGARRGGQVASVAAPATMATGITAVILPPLLRYLGRLGLEEELIGGRRQVGHVFCGFGLE
jgi:hypothetical protein